MSAVNILVHGRHPKILQTVLRLINERESWRGEGSTDTEEIIELLHRRTYEVILLGGGVDDIAEKKIRAIVRNLGKQTAIVQHYGGGSGLLYAEIQAALDQLQGDNVHLVDNPFGK